MVHWGFRLQRGLVYEVRSEPRTYDDRLMCSIMRWSPDMKSLKVKKGGWAEAVSLRLGGGLSDLGSACSCIGQWKGRESLAERESRERWTEVIAC